MLPGERQVVDVLSPPGFCATTDLCVHVFACIHASIGALICVREHTHTHVCERERACDRSHQSSRVKGQAR